MLLLSVKSLKTRERSVSFKWIVRCTAYFVLLLSSSCTNQPTYLEITVAAYPVGSGRVGFGGIVVAPDKGVVGHITEQGGGRLTHHTHSWPCRQKGQLVLNEERQLFVARSRKSAFGEIQVSASIHVFRLRNDTPVRAIVTFVNRDGKVLAKGNVPAGETWQAPAPAWFANTGSSE